MSLKNKTILLGVCSSIAAYKTVELARLLSKEGAKVNVVMTENAVKIVKPEEFEKIRNVKVCSQLFNPEKDYRKNIGKKGYIEHIMLADADLAVVAPCSANLIGKLAYGLCDDLLSTTLIATKADKIICPVMNTDMYNNPVVQHNIETLKKNNKIIQPEFGRLACGKEGKGRLPEIRKIFEEIKFYFSKKDLEGKKILITAGPTIEEIDPVRFISNKSSGKMGYSLAEAAKSRGADVTLISGPTNLEIPDKIKFISVKTANDMRNSVLKTSKNQNIIIMAAAVADFSPVKKKNKMKKGKNEKLILELVKNPDILSEISKNKSKNQKLVGFALETDNLIKNAKEKLKNKNLDLIVANNEKALNADKAKVVLITKNKIKKLKEMSKLEIANKILDEIR